MVKACHSTQNYVGHCSLESFVEVSKDAVGREDALALALMGSEGPGELEGELEEGCPCSMVLLYVPQGVAEVVLLNWSEVPTSCH